MKNTQVPLKNSLMLFLTAEEKKQASSPHVTL